MNSLTLLQKKASLFSACALLACLTPHSVFAQATSGGRGGTGVILPDDTVVLADAYVTDSTMATAFGTEIQLPAPLRDELNRIQYLTDSYAESWLDGSNDRTHMDIFFRDNVQGKQTKYFLVNEIPANCHYSRPVGGIAGAPTGSQEKPAACTEGSHTFLIKDLFLKMSIREQALTIVHERLRAEPIGQGIESDFILAKIYQGLSVLLNRIALQSGGDTSALSNEEVTKVNEFRCTLFSTHLLTYQDLPSAKELQDCIQSVSKELSSGGGLIRNRNKVDASAFIGAGTVILNKSKIGQNSKISGVLQKIKVTFGDNVEVQNIKISGTLSVGSNSSLLNTSIGLKFKDLLTYHQKVEIGSSVKISNVVINAEAGGFNGAPFEGFNQTRGKIQILDSVRLANVVVSGAIKRKAAAFLSPLTVTASIAQTAIIPLNIVLLSSSNFNAVFLVPIKANIVMKNLNYDGQSTPCKKLELTANGNTLYLDDNSLRQACR